MHTLEQVGHALRSRLGADEIPKLINTRVFLRTGVNLMDVKSVHNTDSAMITKVVGTLRELGHPLT